MATLVDHTLTSVADVKETLGIDSGDSSKNNLIVRAINNATYIIENYTQRRFAETIYTDEEYDASGITELLLRNRPVISFSSIGVRNNFDNTNSWTTINTNEYWTDLSAGIVKGIGRFYGGFNRWRVTYTAGYATIPPDVAEAAVRLSAFLVDNATSGTNVKRKQEGQREIEYFDTSSREGSNSLIDQLGLDEILAPYTEPLISGQR